MSVSTIQLWANSGLLQSWTTAGGHRRITRSSVEKMLKHKISSSQSRQEAHQLDVLVVEDDEQLLRLYEKNLAESEIYPRILTAKNGYEGLIKIGRVLPDVIITDLIMPHMDGFQMLKAINEVDELNNSLVIVITGLDDKEISAHGGLNKRVKLFKKPASLDDLDLLLSEKHYEMFSKHKPVQLK